MDELQKGVGRETGSGQAVNPQRVLAASLDTLVRAQRAGSVGTESVAGRLLQHWAELGEIIVALEPTLLRVGEDCLVHPEKTEEYRWLLPAFMAGLRRLRLLPNARMDNVLRLGQELAALEPTLEAIQQFQEWLWADGAEGFDYTVDMGFAECLEDAAMDLKARRKELVALRIDAARSLSDAFLLSTQDLDAAAARGEFELVLERLTEALAQGSLQLDQEAADRFKSEALDPVYWVETELDLVLCHPELESAFPARQMGQRILDGIGEDSAGLLVALLASLRRRQTAFTKDLVAVMEKDPRAAQLVGFAPVNLRTLEAIRAILADAPTPVSKALAVRVVHQGQADPNVGDAVARLVAEQGFQAFCGHLDCHTLDRVAGVFLAKAMEGRRSPERLRQFLGAVPLDTAIAIACAISPAMLTAAHEEVLEILKRSDSEQVGRVLACLFHGGLPGARVVGQAMLHGDLDLWSTPALKTACVGLLKCGLGREFLVPLSRQKKVPTWARLVILQATEGDAAVHAEAIAFRVTDVVEVPEIREYLTRARKLAPGGHR
jgi:hypothetical protein